MNARLTDTQILPHLYTIAFFKERIQSFRSRSLGLLSHHGKAKMFLFFKVGYLENRDELFGKGRGPIWGKGETEKDKKLLDSTNSGDLSCSYTLRSSTSDGCSLYHQVL